MKYEVAVDVIDSCAGFTDLETPVGEAWISVQEEVAALRARLAEVEAQRDGLASLVQILIDENPNEQVTEGGGTVLDLWRYDAKNTLAKLEEE